MKLRFFVSLEYSRSVLTLERTPATEIFDIFQSSRGYSYGEACRSIVVLRSRKCGVGNIRGARAEKLRHNLQPEPRPQNQAKIALTEQGLAPPLFCLHRKSKIR